MSSKLSDRDSLDIALGAVSDRWNLVIVRALALGQRRFTDLVHATGAPRDVLSRRLRALEEADVIERQVYGSGGARYRYVLTQKGVDLAVILLVLKQWGDTWAPRDVPRRHLRHTACGNEFRARVTCQRCGEPPSTEDVRMISTAGS